MNKNGLVSVDALAEMAKTDIDAYALWTQSTWTTKNDRERSIALYMGGLGGEAGEIMGAMLVYSKANRLNLYDEAFVYSETNRLKPYDEVLARDSLIKEMGDWMYYWVRTVDELGWRASDTILRDCSVVAELRSIFHTCLTFNKYNGIVIERLKKYVREGRDIQDTKMQNDLAQAWFAFVDLCQCFLIDPLDVQAGNVAKLTDRAARGVLRGAGDNR